MADVASAMAAQKADRIKRLIVYAEGLKARLQGDVPLKHKDSAEGFRQMIQIDLDKTLAAIAGLKG